MTSRLRTSGLILVIALSVVATACGGDDSGGDGTTSTTEQQTTTTTEATTTTTSPTTTTTVATEPVVSGDSNSEWCQAAREAQEQEGENPLNFDPFALSDPATAEAALNEILDQLQMFESLAPPEIEADVEVLVGAFQSFYDVIAAAGFDLLALSEDDIATFDDPGLETATNSIDAYTTGVCGVDFDTPQDPGAGEDDPVAIVLAALGLPAGLIPADVQECVLNTLLAQNPEFIAGIGPGYVPSETDVALLLETAAECGFSLG